MTLALVIESDCVFQNITGKKPPSVKPSGFCGSISYDTPPIYSNPPIHLPSICKLTPPQNRSMYVINDELKKIQFPVFTEPWGMQELSKVLKQ